MPDVSSRRVTLVIVAQAEYEHWDPLTRKGWEPLTQIAQAAKDLADALRGKGYDLQLPHLLKGGTRTEVVEALNGCLSGLSDKGRLLLYWTGHGTGNGTHYLVTKESPRYEMSIANALPARDLANLIAQSHAEKILVVLDTCYSSTGAQSMAQEIHEILNEKTDRPGQSRFAAVIPSAVLKAQEGVLCRVLLKVLTERDLPQRRWTDRDDFIPVSALKVALLKALQAELGEGWQPARPFDIGWDDIFLPNPLYNPNQPAMLVETPRRLLEIPEALALAARGIEVGEGGWYFTGRTRLLSELATWLREGTGLLVVTGPPGSGKSAVLGRMVTLSGPALREAKKAGAIDEVSRPTVPEPGVVNAAVHVKGMSLYQCAQELGGKIGVELPRGASFDPHAFIERVRGLAVSSTVVVDALDESTDPKGIGAFLKALTEKAGVRVLVGSRYRPDGRPLRQDEDRRGQLLALFGQETRILDLRDEADSKGDIAAYVDARLRASRHRDDREIAKVAWAVADEADGVFLYARMVARTLNDAERLDGPLPDGTLGAFEADLKTRFGKRIELVDHLLAALAWGEGEGLSRAVWLTVATAVSAESGSFTDEDVTWVLDHAGFHILESGESGQTVYRLAHQLLADHYLARAEHRTSVQRGIADALSQGFSGRKWLNADRYVLRHLGDHAAAGGVLGRFVIDSGYLAAADPSRLLAALGSLGPEDAKAQRVGAIYRFASNRVFDADPVERMAILHLAAHQEDPGLARGLEPLLTPNWRTRWVRWRRSPTGSWGATREE
jgi:hypothetical protein